MVDTDFEPRNWDGYRFYASLFGPDAVTPDGRGDPLVHAVPLGSGPGQIQLRPSLVEFLVDRLDSPQVVAIQRPELGDRMSLLGGEQLRVSLGAQRLPRGNGELPEPQPIEPLLLLEPLLPGTVGVLEHRRLGEDRFRAAVQAEILERQT